MGIYTSEIDNTIIFWETYLMRERTISSYYVKRQQWNIHNFFVMSTFLSLNIILNDVFLLNYFPVKNGYTPDDNNNRGLVIVKLCNCPIDSSLSDNGVTTFQSVYNEYSNWCQSLNHQGKSGPKRTSDFSNLSWERHFKPQKRNRTALCSTSQ